jgi:hypothetical protein
VTPFLIIFSCYYQYIFITHGVYTNTNLLVIIRTLTHSSYCVLHFIFPARGANFLKVIYCPLHKKRPIPVAAQSKA